MSALHQNASSLVTSKPEQNGPNQVYRRIQGYKDTGIHGKKYTKIQGIKRYEGYKDTGMQGYRDTAIHGNK